MIKSLLCLCLVFVVGPLAAAPSGASVKRQRDTTKAGDMAPDFSLKTLDGTETIRLADFRGKKPVVLIFGSYTCPPFRDVYPTLERLHEEHGEQVAFFYVYIREAHAEDGWKTPRNEREGIVVREPKTMAERVKVAGQACDYFKTNIPALVDAMDNAVDRAYAAWPSRIFVVDVNGRLAVHGAPGPAGLVPAAKSAEAWLKAYATISAAGIGLPR